MTDRRPGPPLFELLAKDQPDPEDGHGSAPGQETHAAQTPAQQAVKPAEPSAKRSAPISAGVSLAERSAATMPEESGPAESGVHLSMSRVYMSIALIAVALVLVWATAYKSGVAQGKLDMEPLISDKPLVLPPTDFGQTNPVDSTNVGSEQDSSVGEPPRVPATAVEAVMTAQGFVEADPRVSGNNYLQLATFSSEQAADAILFMNDNGIPIIGVPVVDSAVRAGNNPSRYTLYSLGLAVPGGGQFRAMEAQRAEHKRAIASLGSRWQRERRGGSDFGESKTQWVKYN